jgi:hypothetical protein
VTRPALGHPPSPLPPPVSLPMPPPFSTGRGVWRAAADQPGVCHGRIQQPDARGQALIRPYGRGRLKSGCSGPRPPSLPRVNTAPGGTRNGGGARGPPGRCRSERGPVRWREAARRPSRTSPPATVWPPPPTNPNPNPPALSHPTPHPPPHTHQPPPQQATVYVYQLVENNVKVEKIDYQKPGAPPSL